jgi:hypothetical protein
LDRYLPLITGSGGCLVVLAIVCWLLVTGALHSDREFRKLEQENDELRAAYDKLLEAVAAERKTVNETASAGAVTNQLIGVIASLAAGGRAAPAKGLTAGDIGL